MSQKKLLDDETVLKQALLAFSVHGAENFTLADIGRWVGLAPATLLQRFGSKQQLLVQAAKQAHIQLKQDLEILKNRNLPWDEELLELLSGMPEGFGSRHEIANSLGILKLDMIDPELHPIARTLFNSLRMRIEELLTKGASQGDLDPSLAISEITWELEALRHGLVIQWTLSGEGTLHPWIQNKFTSYLKRLKK